MTATAVSATTASLALSTTDIRDVATQRLDVLNLADAEHIPTIPDLPALGATATGISRILGLPGFLPVELRSYGWQLYSHDSAGRSTDQDRASRHWTRLEQAISDAIGEHQVPSWSLRLLGPVSCLARIFLPQGGQRALRDYGARAELVSLWAYTVAEHVHRLALQWGTRRFRVIIEEPYAADIQAGQISTASGHLTERAVDISEIRGAWELAVQKLTANNPADAATDEPVIEVFFAPAPRQGLPTGSSDQIVDTMVKVLRTNRNPELESARGLELQLPLPESSANTVSGTEDTWLRRSVWPVLEDIAHTSGLAAQLSLPAPVAQSLEPGRVAQRLVERIDDHGGLDPADILFNGHAHMLIDPRPVVGVSSNDATAPGHRATYERTVAEEVTDLIS